MCGLKGFLTSLVESEDGVDARDWAVRRTLLAGASLAIVVTACGGSMSEDEYVEGLNNLVATAVSDLESSSFVYEQIGDPTKADLVALIDREIAISHEARQEFDALDPPDSIADVHRVIDDVLARSLTAAEGLVAVIDTVGSLEEVEQTPEFAEYQAANADADRICLDVQTKLDDLVGTSEVFSDVPWMPTLRLTVQAALGCGEFEAARQTR